VTREAILKGKPCLVEKAFMANYRESKDIVDLAREHKVFVAEAIWTRYQPAVQIIHKLIADDRIGTPQLISATIGYPMLHKERLLKPELCGGALLDVGVYAINFFRMFCDAKVERVISNCMKSDLGVDLQNAASYVLDNGVMANIQSSALCVNDNQGVISGTKACLAVDDINNPQVISIFGRNHVLEEEFRVPDQITGYEYEFLACKESLENNWTESPMMPLDETLTIMKMMDDLRMEWGVRYPMD
jgi:predicted dehydrogenase